MGSVKRSPGAYCWDLGAAWSLENLDSWISSGIYALRWLRQISRPGSIGRTTVDLYPATSGRTSTLVRYEHDHGHAFGYWAFVGQTCV